MKRRGFLQNVGVIASAPVLMFEDDGDCGIIDRFLNRCKTDQTDGLSVTEDGTVAASDVDELRAGPGVSASSPASGVATLSASGVDARIPTLVTLRKDAGTAYAFARDGSTIDSGSDHAAVLQSAVDHVYSNHVDTSINSKGAEPPGFIDGGGETFDVSSAVSMGKYIGLKNLTLDAGGRNGFIPLRIESQDGVMPRGWRLQDVQVANTGDSPGILAIKAAWAKAEDIAVRNCGANGIVLRQTIGLKFLRPKSNNNSGSGLKYEDTADGAGQFNIIRDGNFADNGDRGITWTCNNQSKPSSNNRIEGNNFGKNTNGAIIAEEGFQGSAIRDNWLEGTSGIYVGKNSGANCSYTEIEQNRLGSDSVIDINRGTGITVSQNQASEGFTFDITVRSGCTDAVIEYNGNVGTYTNNGTGTTRTTY